MSDLVSLPRVALATLPTPLVPAPRLSDAIGAQVWLKRDDLTGLGLGGNKARGLEYLLGAALDQGCDCLVTGAGPQSNWAMLAALAARRVGLDPHLVYYGTPKPPVGNHQLAALVGAAISHTGDPERASVDPAIDATADALRAQGRRPYVLPRGGATALGAVGYVQASVELAEQLAAARLEPAQLWLATGSCATQAGLVAGARLVGLPYQVVGVTVSRVQPEAVQRVSELAAGAAELVGGPGPDAADVTVLGGFLGPGYGLPSAEGDDAAALVAQTEGVLLDPVFGAKAMAALIAALIAAGPAGPPEGPVVFLVSGGAPTLFVR